MPNPIDVLVNLTSAATWFASVHPPPRNIVSSFRIGHFLSFIFAPNWSVFPLYLRYGAVQSGPVATAPPAPEDAARNRTYLIFCFAASVVSRRTGIRYPEIRKALLDDRSGYRR